MGNKEENYLKWLKGKAQDLSKEGRNLILNKVREVKKTANSILKKQRKKVLEYAKVNVIGKNFILSDGKKLILSTRDVKDILNKPHINYLGKNTLLFQLHLLFQLQEILNKVIFISSADDNQGRKKYKKWYYYKYKNFYFNVVLKVRASGLLGIHSISGKLK